MTPPWWLCAAGKTLRQQILARFPDRDKTSDGSIGDARHAASKSDHNPDPLSGVVRAIDIDEDLLGKDKPDPHEANLLVAELVWLGFDEPRLSYVIFEGVIWSRVREWRPRRYTGVNQHSNHIHVSFTPAGDNDARVFDLPMLKVPRVP